MKPVRSELISVWQSIKDDFKFSKFDFGWLKTLFAYLFNKEAPYRDSPGVFTLPEKSRLVIVGDWGTGTDAAINLLRQIKQYKPDYFMHLGDIYYSGTKNEIVRRFLNPLQMILPDCRYFSLMGNHDAYSGGQGYYWLVDTIGQQSCHFKLSNNRIQLIGMNTGWSDRFSKTPVELHSSEAEWVKSNLNQKTILFSHHQPFSGFQAISNIVASQLENLNNVEAWFTGHEHRLAIYHEYNDIKRMRTVGAGGVPELVREDYFKSTIPCQPITYGNDGIRYYHSFAIMDIDQDNVTVRYFDEQDNVLYSENF